MKPQLILAALALAAMLPPMPAGATASDLRSITGMQNHNRVLLVFAPSLHDARLVTQNAVMARLAVEAAKRDLLYVQVDPMTVIGASDKADHLRRRFHVPVEKYHALLIGKDGNVAFESGGVVQGEEILHRIDAMPMRQEEVRRAKAGLPPPKQP